MIRGRKKGGMNINSIDDRGQLMDMIKNQINSLNKKTKAFKNAGVDEHLNYLKSVISEDMGQFLDNGNLRKSMSFYVEKNTVWLKKTLSALHKANNHYAYGTINKYKSELNDQMTRIKQFTVDYLRERGYSDEFINEVTNSKDYYVQLFDAFSEPKGYGSKQLIEKIALNYNNTETGFTEVEKDKILSNIEYAHNAKIRFAEENELLRDFRNSRNGRKR